MQNNTRDYYLNVFNWPFVIIISRYLQVEIRTNDLSNAVAAFDDTASQAVWPDWAIFLKFLSTDFHTKVGQIFMTFRLFWKIGLFNYLKPAWADLWPTIGKIGLFLFHGLITLASSQSLGSRCTEFRFDFYFLNFLNFLTLLFERFKSWQCDQIWQNFKSLGNFWYGLICIGQTFVPTLAIYYVTGSIFIVVNGTKIEK